MPATNTSLSSEEIFRADRRRIATWVVLFLAAPALMALLLQSALDRNQYDRIHHVHTPIYPEWIAVSAFGLWCLYFAINLVANWNYEIRTGATDFAVRGGSRVEDIAYKDVRRVVIEESGLITARAILELTGRSRKVILRIGLLRDGDMSRLAEIFDELMPMDPG